MGASNVVEKFGDDDILERTWILPVQLTGASVGSSRQTCRMLIPCQRELFDIPTDLAYFNCSYYSPQLNASTARIVDGVRQKSHPWERTAGHFFDDAERIRTLAADTLGGDSDGYAVVPSASYGITTAARAVEPGLRAGDRILVTAEEFPSNVLPWRRTAYETGAVVQTAPTPADGDWTRAVLDLMGTRTRVVAVSTCHWTNGARLDLAAVSRRCRDLVATLVVDATQTFGATPFPMSDVQPDFLVAAGYKWLLGPYGYGLLHVAERWRDARPLEESWLTRANARDFAGLVNYSDTYRPGARRFDVGETLTASLAGAVAALEQINAWGVANIGESLAATNRTIARHLADLGFTLPPESVRSQNMFGAELPERYTGNLVADLQERKIHASQRGRAVRFAPHLHISDQDLRLLLDTLTELFS